MNVLVGAMALAVAMFTLAVVAGSIAAEVAQVLTQMGGLS